MIKRRGMGVLLPLCLLLLAGCSKDRSGQVLDEASRAGRTAASFPAADEDYFHDMDGGVALTPEEIKGRNTWIVWTGGNDRFWDAISINSFGAFDLPQDALLAPAAQVQPGQPLELPRPRQRALLREGDRPGSRALRPVARQARARAARPDPFENDDEVPRRRDRRARQDTCRSAPTTATPTGIVGLRLFPNPDFDEAAAKKWDAERYYSDPKLLPVERSRQALPRRHVLRLLPRRPEPGQAAGRSRASRSGRT